MKRTIVTAAATFALVAAVFPSTPGLAERAPATQHVISRGLVSRPYAVPLTFSHTTYHSVYGRLESMRGKMLTLRVRSGRLWNVDASEALTSGAYSAPLFVGKIVEVDASLDRSGVLHAKSIMRMENLDRSTPGDR